ncbi:MAG: ribonuclease HII [Clostridia bacterium]|nr:ribonuclease HII [Clostridia bacterium]
MAHTSFEKRKQERFTRMNRLEEELRSRGFVLVAGLDEAGRGPLAGPVYAAAVILKAEDPIWGLNDSKKLSPQVREALASEIKNRAVAWAIVSRNAEYIDRHNILEATRSAMEEALSLLQPPPDFALLDAMRLGNFPPDRQRSIVKGDATSNAIAAASILAKTARDSEMLAWDEQYPAYGFAAHKGYGTAAHYEALDANGPCPLHRTSFLRSWFKKNENYGGKK